MDHKYHLPLSLKALFLDLKIHPPPPTGGGGSPQVQQLGKDVVVKSLGLRALTLLVGFLAGDPEVWLLSRQV